MKVVRLSASHTGRLYPRKCSWYSFSLGAESTPRPWYGRKEYVIEKSSDTTGNRSWGAVRLLAQRLNHYATPSPVHLGRFIIYLCINYIYKISEHARYIELLDPEREGIAILAEVMKSSCVVERHGVSQRKAYI